MGPVVGVALALWLVRGMWGDGVAAGGDTVGHLVRARYALDHLIPHGRVDGWQTSFALGYQEFLFVGPLLSWAVGLVRLLTLGTVSVLSAFEVVLVASVAAMPLVTAYLARSFGLGTRAAGLAAVLVLAVDSPFGGQGLTGLFQAGLTVHQAGAVFFVLAVGAVVRLLTDPSPRRVVVLGVTVALVLVTHGVSAILLAGLVPILVVLVALEGLVAGGRVGAAPRSRTAVAVGPRTVVGLAAAATLGLGLAAVTVVPVAAHRSLRGALTTWPFVPLSRQLTEIWHGRILFHSGMAKWLLVGLAYGLWRAWRGRPLALTLVLAPFAFLLLGDVLHERWPHSVIGEQIPNRGLGYAGVLAVLPLAAGLAGVSRRLGAGGALGALVVAVALVAVPLGDSHEVARDVRPSPAAVAAAAELRRRVPAGARYAMQRDPAEGATLGEVPPLWMAWASGENTLNVFNVESSSTPGPAYTPDRLSDMAPDEAADALCRYGVTHVLLTNLQRAAHLLTSPRFRRVWEQGGLAVAAVRPRPGQPPPASLVSGGRAVRASLTDPAPEHPRFRVEVDRPTQVSLAVAWSPKWHVSVGGRRRPLARTPERLLAVGLPPGRHRLALDFVDDGWDRLGRLVTVFSGVGLAGWALRRRRAAVSA